MMNQYRTSLPRRKTLSCPLIPHIPMKMSIPSSYRVNSYAPGSFPKRFPYSLHDLAPHDDAPATEFYTYSRMVHHIDENAVAELNKFYGDVLPAPVIAEGKQTDLPKVLDLASSWVSHIPLKSGNVFPRNRVVGVGLNAQELKANPILSHYKVLDLDAQPDVSKALAGAERGKAFEAVQEVVGKEGATAEPPFDAVVCNVSIDYLTRPLDVLYHTANVIKPGGWVYLAISNRCFPTKVVRPWLNLSEPDRLDLVASYFHFAGTAYSPSPPLPKTSVMKQPTRPDDSGYPNIQPGGLYEQIESIDVVSRESRSDPLWVVRAKRRSG